MHTRVSYFMNLIAEMRSYSKDEIIDWQNNKLQKLVRHSFENTRYYNNIFASLKILPKDIKEKKDLKIIPALTKEIIKTNYNDIIPGNLNKIRHKESSTGGSSGDPLKFKLDLDSWSYITAMTILKWEETGYNYGDPYLAIGSTSLFVKSNTSLKHNLYYKMKNRIGVNGVNMNNDTIKNYIEIIKNKKIKYLYGYASSIYLIASFVKSKNIDVNIKAVFPTSEILTDHYRDTIHEAFNCTIMDTYGAHDGGIIAFETSRNFYEVGYNSLLTLENIQEGIGDALLTNLFNYSLPFLNYQVGDKVKLNEGMNNKYNGQVISNVYGRESDVIILENGSIITGPGFTILFKDLPVERYSVSKIGENAILIKIIKENSYNSSHEEIVLQTLKNNVGADCVVKIEYDDKKHSSFSSGKSKYFYSN